MQELLTRLFSRPLIAAELIGASLLANLLALASPLFVIQVLNRYVAYGVDATLATLTAGVLIAVAMEFGFRQIRVALGRRAARTRDAELAALPFHRLTTAKIGALAAVPDGAKQEAAGAADTVRAAMSPANMGTLLDVPFALLFLAVLFLLSPLLAVIAAVFVGGLFALSLAVVASMKLPGRRLQAENGQRGALLATNLRAAETVRAFNLEAAAQRRWGEASQRVAHLAHMVAGRQALLQTLTHAGQALLSVAIIAAGAMQVVAGNLDVGALIGANLLAARALGPIIGLARLSEPLAKASRTLELVRDLARLPQERTQGTGLVEPLGRIELRDLAFVHPGAKGPLFERLALTLEPGQTLAVTGGNGAGKTTVAKLLLGLYEPSRGQILVDGVELAQVAPHWWRDKVAYLPQEPAFLPGTLADAVLDGLEAPDPARLDELLRRAGLKAFVDESRSGLLTQVERNGDNLSLGIRRRLALARALARPARVWVFDEPTEGLDQEGAALVYKALNEASDAGHTIVVCSHDPNILKGVDLLLDLAQKPVPVVRRLRGTAAPLAAAPSPLRPAAGEGAS